MTSFFNLEIIDSNQVYSNYEIQNWSSNIIFMRLRFWVFNFLFYCVSNTDLLNMILTWFTEISSSFLIPHLIDRIRDSLLQFSIRSSRSEICFLCRNSSVPDFSLSIILNFPLFELTFDSSFKFQHRARTPSSNTQLLFWMKRNASKSWDSGSTILSVFYSFSFV